MQRSKKTAPLDPRASSILAEAHALPITHRIDLIERIVSTIEEDDPSCDHEWLKEAEDRLAAYHADELGAVDAEDVFNELSNSSKHGF